MFLLRTFGSLSIELDGEPVAELSGNRKALILLAILAADGPVARDRLLALLWSESDAERARGSLKQTLHLIRRTLNTNDVITGVAELRLNDELIRSDVGSFRGALSADALDAAVLHYRGAFLDGVYTANAPEFERWLDQRREDFQLQYGGALERLAERAEARSDYAGAVGWWRRRQALDPTNGTVAARLIRALDAVGDRAAALRHARMHETILRDDFDLPADPTVSALAGELRSTAQPAAEATYARIAARVPALLERTADAERMQARQRRFARLVGASMLAVLLTTGGVVAAFNLTRRPAPANGTPPAETNRGQAYAYLLEGKRLLQQKGVQSTADAKSYFQQAIALDPNLVDAYVALAAAELAPALTDPEPRLLRARQAALRALAMDSMSVAAHTIMIWVKTQYERDYAGAERHFRKAYQIDPDYPPLHNAYAAYLLVCCDEQASLRALLRAYELSPNVPANPMFLGMRYLMMGNLQQAAQYIDASLQRDSAFFMAHWARGRLHLEQKQYDAALREFSRPGTDLLGIHQEAMIGYTHALRGDTIAARTVLASLLERRKSGGYVAPSDIAVIYIGLGEHDKALDWLEQLIEHRSRIFLKADPIFDPLRALPRFQRLLSELGLTAVAE